MTDWWHGTTRQRGTQCGTYWPLTRAGGWIGGILSLAHRDIAFPEGGLSEAAEYNAAFRHVRHETPSTALAALVLETKPPVTSGSDVTKAGDLQMFESTRDSIRARLVELTVPTVAVGVARDGEILMEEAFGWADREKRIEAGEHTMYSWAAISKPITATGRMLLVERGEVDLDRPVNDYLGDAKVKAWVGDTADATVRRVANHTSGLAVHYHFFHEDEEARPPSRDETILRYGHLVRAPGEHYDYANLGYGILDYVISRVSGRSYSDFMREEVFLPLGLTHTSVHVGPGLEGQAAVRYGNDGLPISFYDFDHPGASAVFSSARDLVRFGMFHLKAHRPDQKAILSDEAIDEMQSPTAEINSGMGYGVGWRVAEHDLGYRTVSHAGGMGGRHLRQGGWRRGRASAQRGRAARLGDDRHLRGAGGLARAGRPGPRRGDLPVPEPE